jgi:hypothetical protein
LIDLCRNAAQKTQIEELTSAASEQEKATGKLESDRNRLFNALNGVLKEKEKLQEDNAGGAKSVEELSAHIAKLEADIQNLTKIS